MKEAKKPIAYAIGNSIFAVLRKEIEPFGFHWKEDKKRVFGGYFEVDMPGTGVKWKTYVTKNHWIFVPEGKLPTIKHIHYSFPFALGIWFHRTILWEDGRKTHEKFTFRSGAPLTLRKYDITKDYLALKEKLLKLD